MQLMWVHEPFPLPWEEAIPVVLVNPQFHVCTSLVPKPMTVVIGLGTRLHVVQDQKMASFATNSSSLVPKPHPAYTRRKGLVSQVQIFGLAPEAWSGQSIANHRAALE